jgi:hypothetical protein
MGQMRASFWGIEVGVTTDHGVHVCGIRDPKDKHVLFQRDDAETDPAEIHFEYCDQGNGGYDFVSQCRLSRRMLSLELSKPMRAFPDVVGIDVTLELDDSAYLALSNGLAVIFAHCPERLVVD